jgi:hypothetical protein
MRPSLSAIATCSPAPLMAIRWTEVKYPAVVTRSVPEPVRASNCRQKYQ